MGLSCSISRLNMARMIPFCLQSEVCPTRSNSGFHAKNSDFGQVGTFLAQLLVQIFIPCSCLFPGIFHCFLFPGLVSWDYNSQACFQHVKPELGVPVPPFWHGLLGCVPVTRLFAPFIYFFKLSHLHGPTGMIVGMLDNLQTFLFLSLSFLTFDGTLQCH